MMRGKARHGFTLVELMIVLAIIGVLAAIIIPSLIGYVRKANKKADVATASMIGKAMVSHLTLYPNHWDDIHINQGNAIHNVVAVDSMGNVERYKYRNLLKMNGSPRAAINDNNTVGYKWGSGTTTNLMPLANQFTEECKENIIGGNATSNSGFLIPMKTIKHNDPDYPEKAITDRWLIGVRCLPNGKDTETIEVWAGWSEATTISSTNPGGYIYGGMGNGPTYRLWPNPDREYLRAG